MTTTTPCFHCTPLWRILRLHLRMACVINCIDAIKNYRLVFQTALLGPFRGHSGVGTKKVHDHDQSFRGGMGAYDLRIPCKLVAGRETRVLRWRWKHLHSGVEQLMNKSWLNKSNNSWTIRGSKTRTNHGWTTHESGTLGISILGSVGRGRFLRPACLPRDTSCLCAHVCIYIYIYIYMWCMYIYIYIEREIER